MIQPLSNEEANLLIEMCRRGQLYAVQTWINEGKSIIVSPALKKTPLSVAVDQGFHSLVELLLNHLETNKKRMLLWPKPFQIEDLTWSSFWFAMALRSVRSLLLMFCSPGNQVSPDFLLITIATY